LTGTAIASISVYHLQIPLKHRVEHAASVRTAADPVVVRIELQNGDLGYGESLPRPYVTGEDHDSVDTAVRDVFVPLLMDCRPQSFSEALVVIESLPLADDAGRQIPTARATVELALLDVYSRCFERPIGLDVVNWLEVPEFGPPGCINHVRCSGVIATKDPQQAVSTLRKMRCYGLRNFKLKVGSEGQDDLLTAVTDMLGPAILKGRASLRLDANGAWSLDDAIEHLSRWSDLNISHIEQPLARGDEQNLPNLKAHTQWQIIHDESLATLKDAQRLFDLGVADCFNIRMGKCGGFIPSLKLVRFCRQNHIDYMLGCLVGQTSILSAVERCFLSCVPGAAFVESNFGSFLLADDIARPKLRFRYGGKLKPLTGFGWSITVDEDKLAEFCEEDPLRLNL